MSKASQSSNIIASRYVNALIDLAEDSKKIKDVEKDFTDLAAMTTSSDDFQYLIRSPLISQEKQLAGVEAIAKKARFTEITTNFLKVLVSNRRLAILENVLETFREELSKRKGEVVVTVETAQDLTAAQVENLQAAMKKQTGANIAVYTKVEPSILGGVIVTVGSHMIDDSVARKLERLKAALSGSVNENVTLKEVS